MKLFWGKEILASASFGGFQFWTETWGMYLVQIKEEFGADLLELRVWWEELEDGQVSKNLEQGKLGLQ